MAVNKNFVVKNGLEVNSNLLVADLDTQTVGIGTTIAPHELHVVGGIGVTNLLVTGVATIANLRVTGPSTFVGVATFTDNNVFIDKNLFVNGINITGGSGGSIGTDLVVQRHVRAGGIVTFSDSLFVGSGLGQSTGTLGQVFQVAGVSSDAYIGGTLGIGTTNPQDLALHVVGDTRFVGVNTFQGDVVVTGNLDVTGDITYDEITGRNLNISGISTFQTLTAGRVALVGTGDTLTDDANLTFAKGGGQLVLGVGATVGGALTVAGATDLNGALDVSGETNFSSGVGIADSIFHIGDDNTQIRFPAADTFTIETAGSEALRVDSSQRLLVGTTTEGNANADNLTVADSANSGITIRSGTSNLGSIFFSDATSGNGEFAGFIDYNHSSNQMSFGAAESTRVTITSDGDVGIGTITPTGSHAVTASNEAVLAVGIVTARKVFASGVELVSGSLTVDGLTENRVPIVGAGSTLEDDANFTFDGSQLILGVGATVGGALTVAGEGTFASTVGIAESIFHVGDTNTSFGFPANDTFTVDTGGVERLRISQTVNISPEDNQVDAFSVKQGSNEYITVDTTNSSERVTIGNVTTNPELVILSNTGIGTTNPTRKLDVEIQTTGAGSVLQSHPIAEFINKSGGAVRGLEIGAPPDGILSPVYLKVSGTSSRFAILDQNDHENFTILDTGLVGLGTDNPDNFNPNADDLVISGLGHQGLTIRSGTAHDGSIMFNDTNDANQRGIIRFDHTTDAMAFHTSSGEALRITGIGSVGIGTTAPEHAFVVRDDGLARIRIRNDSNAANSFASFNLKTRNGEWSMYADGSSGSDDYLKIFRAGSGTHLYFYESIDKIGINSAICQVDVNGNTLGDSKFGFLTSASNTGFHVQTGGERTLKINSDGLISSGIITATDGFALGIHSAGTSVVSGPIKTLNFVGSGNTFAYNASTDTIDISIAGGSGGGSGVTETDTTVSTTNPTGVGSFATASFRSASVIAQINQLNTDFQVGRYLMIHDGTTVTVVEEAAVSTGSTMLGSFTGVIDGSNVELRVTLASAGVSTVTTKIDTVTV